MFIGKFDCLTEYMQRQEKYCTVMVTLCTKADKKET